MQMQSQFKFNVPKSRNSDTAAASMFSKASMVLPSGARHAKPSVQVEAAGHEKRASLQRTALGSGEQANWRAGEC